MERHDFSKNIFDGKEIKKGLLTRILDRIMATKLNSNNRFWVYSCVETFLRGSNFKNQMFVVFSGVLYKLINDVLKINEILNSTSAQITYDFLGEVMKYNIIGVLGLDIICRKRKILKSVLENIGSKVVDSNVFFRGLFLSFEYFKVIPIVEEGSVRNGEDILYEI